MDIFVNIVPSNALQLDTNVSRTNIDVSPNVVSLDYSQGGFTSS